MPERLQRALRTAMGEPPFRMGARFLVKRFSSSVRARAHWDASARPSYWAGVLAAADQARKEGVAGITVAEFGVSGGNGLVALEQAAAEAALETGVAIDVFGFDTGSGLPESCGDYRDHPDEWQKNDYPTDFEALRSRLRDETVLVLGNVAETVPAFVASQQRHPIGFASIDVDYYSSTVDCLRLFTLPGRRMLRRTFLYFDDVAWEFSHRFAGELLAIDEFNAEQARVKIDRWRSLAEGRPFFEAGWIQRMYLAHDLEAIDATVPRSAPKDYLHLRS